MFWDFTPRAPPLFSAAPLAPVPGEPGAVQLRGLWAPSLYLSDRSTASRPLGRVLTRAFWVGGPGGGRGCGISNRLSGRGAAGQRGPRCHFTDMEAEALKASAPRLPVPGPSSPLARPPPCQLPLLPAQAPGSSISNIPSPSRFTVSVSAVLCPQAPCCAACVVLSPLQGGLKALLVLSYGHLPFSAGNVRSHFSLSKRRALGIQAGHLILGNVHLAFPASWHLPGVA